MNAERQQAISAQPELPGFASILHPTPGTGSSPAARVAEAPQPVMARKENRTTSPTLMERIASRANLLQACKRVKANKGAAGIDGQSVDDLSKWLKTHLHELRQELLSGSYRPTLVLGKKIPKPGGGERQLGIPTAKDRLVEQAILQQLEPLLDPTFSKSSYGFRPGRSAHDALKAGSAFVEENYCIVVDLDLEKFFDRVNHDILMDRLARRIGDKEVLRLIRRFLQAGMVQDGVCVARDEGTPQGGPLSPLLANLLLDDLDKELERRGHRFCRYADDCNIYVRTVEAGERVMASVTDFLENKLKLKVNHAKSAVAHVSERKFLGYRLLNGGVLGIAPKSIERLKEKIRLITRRNRGRKLSEVVADLNRLTHGWVAYFKLAKAKEKMASLDQWVRRKIRCLKLKQCKRAKAIATFLTKNGIHRKAAWRLACSGKGWWRLSKAPQTHRAMGSKWFEELGLLSYADRYAKEKLA